MIFRQTRFGLYAPEKISVRAGQVRYFYDLYQVENRARKS